MLQEMQQLPSCSAKVVYLYVYMRNSFAQDKQKVLKIKCFVW